MSATETSIHPTEPVYRLQQGDKEIILIGTAHISQASADLVTEIIKQENPDTVCVELCETRYQTLLNPEAWKKTDIVQVIKQKRTFVLFLNFMLSSVQRRMAKDMNVTPGLEMQAAIDIAKTQNAEIATIDREVRTTLQRVWRLMGFWTKMKLFNQIVMGLFEEEEEDISSEHIESLKEKGALEMLLQEMGEQLPGVKQRLIDERDLYMVEKIKQAPGKKLVAVVGAGHVPGMMHHWQDTTIDLEELDRLPPASSWTTVLKWLIPLLVIVLLVAGFLKGDPASATERGMNGIIGWVVVNGGLAGLGALIAMGHPLTILASIIAAPITSLNPLIGVGYVSGLVEAVLRKPTVEAFEELPEAILTAKGWWGNQVTRILLVFILSSIGSSLGTFIGYGWLIENVFGK